MPAIQTVQLVGASQFPSSVCARLTELARLSEAEGELLEAARVARFTVDRRRRTWHVLFDSPRAWPDDLPDRLAAALARLSSGATVECRVNRTEADRMERMAQEQEAYLQSLAASRDSARNGRGAKNGSSGAPGSGDVLRGKSVRDQPMPIRTVVDEERRVVLEGEVQALEHRALRSGRIRVAFEITDLEDTLPVSLFAEPGEPLLKALADGQWVRLRGPVQHDRYTQELTVYPEDVMLVEPPLRRDEAPRKRVELHLHTRMSQLDGLVDVDRAFARAAAWGHPALGITDHGVVHAFPEAAEAAARHGLKALLGAELFVVDHRSAVLDADARPIDDLDVVVVDLETTGLSPRGHEIIEIGAARVRAGQVVDQFHTLVDPGRALTPEVRQLTGITEDMLVDQPEPRLALEQFWDWVGPDAVLAAHNARFDRGFLYRRTLHWLGRALRPPFIDTLVLSRAILPELKGHGLAQVAGALNAPLNQHHRALSDATTAAHCLVALLERLTGEDGPQNLIGLAGLAARVPIRLGRPSNIVVLARNSEGLRDLYRLISRSNLEHFFRVPRVPWAELEARRQGLLIGSGDTDGPLLEAVLSGAPDDEVEAIARRFDFIEVQPPELYRHLLGAALPSDADVEVLIADLVALAERTGVPAVATGDVHFVDPHEELFRAILRRNLPSGDERLGPFYLRTTQEMLDAFAFLGPEAAERIVVDHPCAIADRCERLDPVPSRLFAPEVPGAEEEVSRRSRQRALELYGDPLPESIAARLERELAAICGHGYAGIYLTAMRLIERSLEHGYLVGSRGSVGSSFVAFLTGITEVNPLPPHRRCPACRHTEFAADQQEARERDEGRAPAGSGFDLPDAPCPRCGTPLAKDGHDIPFETFMGFDGDKVPDIDLNFSGEYQSSTHQHAQELFGAEHVFRAGTIATVAQKSAYGFVRSYAEQTGRLLRRAEMNRLARALEGVKRTTGQHPGGVVILPKGLEIEQFTPVQHPADDTDAQTIITHFDFHAALEGRLLKLDLLGHDDPTVLRKLADLTGVDPRQIPFDDPKVLSIYSSTEALDLVHPLPWGTGTVGVPEFGTAFVRRMLGETHPKTFADLVRICGLAHGTNVWTNNAQALVQEGRVTLAEIIPSRDDIMIYLMRRGLPATVAFKIMESVRKGRGVSSEQEEMMRQAGVPDWYIESCQKISYLFPKAHAAAYVMMGYRIAWYKVHHPLAFYATYFTVRADQLDLELCRGDLREMARRIEALSQKADASVREKNLLTHLEVAYEMRCRGYEMWPVSLAASGAAEYQIEGRGLRPPFSALAGLGEAAARAIVLARAEGPFRSVEDLRQRARASKTVVELLGRAGCLTDLPDTNQMSLF